MKLPANYIYVKMELDDRELLYQRWCKQAKLDPTCEATVEGFFAAIDGCLEEELDDGS